MALTKIFSNGICLPPLLVYGLTGKHERRKLFMNQCDNNVWEEASIRMPGRGRLK